MSTHSRPGLADFDFWKFWLTNENFEIFKNVHSSESTSKNPMVTFDKVLESSNIIFFDSKILGTIWVTYVHMKSAKIIKIHKIFTAQDIPQIFCL